MCLAEMKFPCTTSLYYRIQIHGEVSRGEFLTSKELYENVGFPCDINTTKLLLLVDQPGAG